MNFLKRTLHRVQENQNTPEPTAAREAQASGSSPEPDYYKLSAELGDEILYDAIQVIFSNGCANTSILQRKLKIGYARAASLIDKMEELGVIGAFSGSKPREILVTERKMRQILRAAEQKKHAPSAPFQEPTSSSSTVLNAVDAMSGHDFERWCADLLKKLGFVDVSVTPGSGDQGVDVLAGKDGIKYAIQCKCYSSDLGNTPVQEVYAGKSMYRCHVAVVMTNRHFTSGAKELAENTGVLLWDREKLQEMLAQAASGRP